MSNITVKELFSAGLHFGHQTQRWNPKMKPYIYGERNGIYIVNLDLTRGLFQKACGYVTELVASGKSIMFVGTKKQAGEIIKSEAERCGMPFVNHRWLGGMMTNFQTIRQSIERLKSLEAMQADGSISRFPKKEILLMEKELIKLQRNIGGIKHLKAAPAAIFIIDPRNEHIAVNEANKLGIPVVALTDTNCSPDGIDYIIPGNDDAIRAIRLVAARVADAVMAGMEVRAAGEGAEAESAEEILAEAEAATEQIVSEDTVVEDTVHID